MTKKVFYALLVLVLAVVIHSGCGERGGTSVSESEKVPEDTKKDVEVKKAASGEKNGRPASMAVSKEAALDIARKAVSGIAMPKDCPVDTQLKDEKYIVTFRIKNDVLEPGPDYYARITIDAKTGDIIEKLAAQ